MKLVTTWKGKSLFEASDGQHTSVMDAKPPFGQDTALSPKQLLLASISGCTGIDVVGHLRKSKAELTAFSVEAQAESVKSYPAVFQEILLDFYLEGKVDPEAAKEAVALSQSQYCSVSAMVAKASPIRYRIHINGALVHEDQAKFV